MTPEIKTAKLNTADFGKAKITEKGMPEKNESSKLSDTISGNKGAAFGSFSKSKSSLADSLATKTSAIRPSLTEESTKETNDTTSVFSGTQQSDYKSKLSTLQSDVINVKNNSIFSAPAKTGGITTAPLSSTLSLSSEAQAAANTVSTARSNAQAYIGEAQSFAKQAEAAAKDCDWATVISYYQKAQESLTKAADEVNNASKNGEDLGDLKNQIAGLMTDYNHRIDSASKFLSTGSIGSGVSGSSDSGEDSSNDWLGWTMLGVAGLAALGGLFGGKKAGNSNSAGSSSGSQESGGVSDGEKLDESNASDEAKNEIKSKGVDSEFKTAAAKSQNLSAQKTAEERKAADYGKQIADLTDKLPKDSQLKKSAEEYSKAKKAQADNEKDIAQFTAQEKEQKAIVDGINSSIEKKQNNIDTNLKPAETAAKERATQANAALDDANKDVESKKRALEDTKNTQPVNEANVQLAENALIKAEAEQRKAKAEKEKADNDLAEKTKARENAETEVNNLKTKDLPPAQQKLEKAKTDKEKAEGKREALAEEVETEAKALEDATDEAENIKEEIDDLYEKQSEAQNKAVELDAQIEAQEQIKDFSQDTANEIIDKWNDKNGSSFFGLIGSDREYRKK